MKKLDNHGLSLIELLIAVFIMAILSVPILHSFVSSYHINARSRESLRATTLAQNEMEIFEREKLEDLLDPEKYDYTVSVPDEENAADPGIYTFARTGIINDNSGRSQFDVYVTLDPQRQSGQKYDAKNSEELLELNSFSIIDSCRFVQTVRSEHNKVSQDDLVYQEFAEDSKADGTDHDAEYYEKNLDRRIIVDIKKDPVMPDEVTVKVTRKYTDGTVKPKKSKEKTEIIFNNSQSLDEDGKPVALKGVYIFYAPRFINKKDVIEIHNDDGVPADIYVIRQDLSDGSGGAVQLVPNTYQPMLIVSDPLTDGKCSGIYHTNLNIAEPPEAVTHPGKQVQLKLNGSDTDRNGIIEQMGLARLNEGKKKDRIYDMTVKVYKTGADISTDSPLTTMTGTKLE